MRSTSKSAVVLGAKTLLLGGIAIHIAAHIALGRRQVVRHQVLVLAFGSSNLSAPAKVEKKSERSPEWAAFWVFPRNSLLWLHSTKNLEPISSVMAAEPCRLSPNACAGKPALAPPEKPFALFFEFPPAEISFFSCKGCFLVVACRFSDLALIRYIWCAYARYSVAFSKI